MLLVNGTFRRPRWLWWVGRTIIMEYNQLFKIWRTWVINIFSIVTTPQGLHLYSSSSFTRGSEVCETKQSTTFQFHGVYSFTFKKIVNECDEIFESFMWFHLKTAKITMYQLSPIVLIDTWIATEGDPRYLWHTTRGEQLHLYLIIYSFGEIKGLEEVLQGFQAYITRKTMSGKKQGYAGRERWSNLLR